MRVAATYEIETGNVFQHFGRTEMFKVYTIENGVITGSELLDPAGEGHGALVGVLQRAGIEALICGGMGGGAQMAMAAAGIGIYAGVTGSADEAAHALAEGRLDASAEANCDHHDHHAGGCPGHGKDHEGGCHH